MRSRWLIALALAGCGKGSEPASTGSAGSGAQVAGSAAGSQAVGSAAAGSAAPVAAASPARDALVATWKQAGLTPSPLAPATTPVGKDCAAGSVSELDLLVCVFASADEAKAAEEAGLQWVGEVTGTARAHGTLLVAVADRHKKDPNGKAINQLMKLASK